jgi:hypothetical protein
MAKPRQKESPYRQSIRPNSSGKSEKSTSSEISNEKRRPSPAPWAHPRRDVSKDDLRIPAERRCEGAKYCEDASLFLSDKLPFRLQSRPRP